PSQLWQRSSDAAVLTWAFRCLPPKDSLDFKLSTIYNHHTALFWSKNQMLCQRETHGSFREKLEKQLKLKQEQETSIRVWVDPRRNTYHYLT
uniref:Uncharacterized protein n=1 Tax=Poecilia reticulata TaxID=8081 RepID=A0A3P9QHF7_POERE